MVKTITGIIEWLKGWFYDKDDIIAKEQALQTQINNKASQSDLNTTNTNVSNLQSSLSGKADSEHRHGNLQSDGTLTTNSGVSAPLQIAITDSNGKLIPTHTLSSEKIQSPDDLDNIGTEVLATQRAINNAIDSKIGELFNIIDALSNLELIEVVQALPDPSLSTMNKLYVVANGGSTANNLYAIYVTVKNNNAYSWEKIDDADLQGYMTTATANNTFAPKSHAVNASTYGLGTTSVYGHVKIINNLEESTYKNGFVLSALQGYILDNSKAPNNHASTNTKFGVGTSDKYGHLKLDSSISDSGANPVTGGAIYTALAGKSNTNHTHDACDVYVSNQVGFSNSGDVDEELDWIYDNLAFTIELVPKGTDDTGAIKIYSANERA